MMNFDASGDDGSGVKPLTSQDLSETSSDGADDSSFSSASGLNDVGGADESGRRTLSANVLLLVLVMAVAGALLYGMRKVGLGVSLDFRTPSIDYPIEQAGDQSGVDDDYEVIIEDLKSSETVVQVPLEDLQRNPFELNQSKSTPSQPKADPEAEARRRAEAKRRQREQEITRTFEAIKVNSIVSGSVPMARINGQAVRIGDTVADLFTVRAIHGRTVELEADGEVYTKTIGK